jgi:predicted DNA binding protein
MVAMAFLENPEGKPEVNHIDGNKLNDNLSNLEWVTKSQNIKHAFDTGLKENAKGFESCHSGLTEEQARFVEKVYMPYHRQFGTRALGRQLGVAHSTIQNHIKRVLESK